MTLGLNSPVPVNFQLKRLIYLEDYFLVEIFGVLDHLGLKFNFFKLLGTFLVLKCKLFGIFSASLECLNILLIIENSKFIFSLVVSQLSP